MWRFGMFQSSPDLTTGCNVSGMPRQAALRSRFNPHPISRPGATRYADSSTPGRKGFNPHPISRPGATSLANMVRVLIEVSILTRSHDRVQHDEMRKKLRRISVSILTRSHDRVQHFVFGGILSA